MDKSTNNLDIAIIGAGASGLISSIFLLEQKFNITIFEKNNKVGKKLLATGNGRCNISNENIHLSNFHTSGDKTLLKQVFHNFDFHKCKNFFNSIGVELITSDNKRVYPMSQNSSSIVDSLEFKASNSGAKINLSSEITSIKYEKNKFILNDKFIFDKVIIATGSIAMPKLGSSDSGYKFAKDFGHNIIKPFASLVQLVSDTKDLDIISGVKIDGIVNNIRGDILFTKYGVSGSAILDISREISKKLQYEKNIKLFIDVLPQFNKNKLTQILTKRAETLGDKDIDIWLDGIINKKLSRYIIKKSNINNSIKYAKFLNKKDILKIVHTLKNLEFNIIGTKGFDYCEVCAGGVDLSQVNLNTMESKIKKDLYFTGEVLDVDGDCGGYNLHFAWASAYLASKAIKKDNI